MLAPSFLSIKECCFSYFSCTKFESKERKEEFMKSKYSLSLWPFWFL
ncbi:MAG: 3-phosphoglycerate dehydrogenase [Enterococcus faecium]|nr:3-phosphoglycerate dehydrogenase [Enterococcus faecium]